MLWNCLFVGCGGFIGSILRYLMNTIEFGKLPLPANTLAVNILGSFAIMFITGFIARSCSLDEHWILFLRVGLCGGFTTFSTFSMETLQMLQDGAIVSAILYAVLSVALCLGAAFLGEALSGHMIPQH